MSDSPFVTGELYRRRDLHAQYKGQRQGGISTPSQFPYIFLITGSTGTRFGYRDEWTPEGHLLYFGEGQKGAMRFAHGNRAIR
jgi:5-methylcytosine-specific restriction enzyme A